MTWDRRVDSVQVRLLPLGKSLTAERGAPLQELLFSQGVEFPCGGRGRCRGCRVRVLEGAVPRTSDDLQRLSQADLDQGWRLACQARANCDLTIELAQWEVPVLADESAFEFSARDGWGVAVDLGTTTIAAQLLDLRSGSVLAVRTGLNAQAQHGADIMSRVEFGVRPGGQRVLERLIRDQIGSMIGDLLTAAGGGSPLEEVVIVGNTVMHHLFCGETIEPLARHPFETDQGGARAFNSDALEWNLGNNPRVHFLPCIGSFVGSDLLAGVVATRLHESDEFASLVDLGTNGEIVVGNRQGMLCASTAAGPAFEGARISIGMRAATGAISEVRLRDGRLDCRVVGQVPPRGVCGSGLVDAVAAGLTLGAIQPSGRLSKAGAFPLVNSLALLQADIRELQLAKGAIAAALRLLVNHWGAGLEDLSRVYLAGAFGNYINHASARRIGLLNVASEKVLAVGNTALLGAKLALFSWPRHGGSYEEVRRKIRHVSLNEDPLFTETYADEMGFPVAQET